jgi:hypothetical protein
MKAIDWVKNIMCLDGGRPTMRFSMGGDVDAKYKVQVFGYKAGQWEYFDYNESGEFTGRSNVRRTH